MGNKKKQPAKSAKDHNSSDQFGTNDQTRPLDQSNIQSTDSFHIKEEPDIKQEPVVVGEFIDVPASTYRSFECVSGSSEHSAEYDFNELSFDEVEIKNECDEKKEEQSKTNSNMGEEAAGSQQDQRPSLQDEESSMLTGSDNNAQNIRKKGNQTDGNLVKRHKCDFCEYSTQYKSNLDRHVLQHTGERPHACNFCPKRFTRKLNLCIHIKAHAKEFLFCCRGCLQGFNGKDEKNKHENSCKICRYECHLCKDSFGSKKTNMMVHMRVHSGNKPFACKVCFKRFAQKYSLRTHMKIHAGPRSFRCSKCLEGFSLQEERNLHEEKCNRRVYECYDCRKSFGSSKSHLICHMLTHSGDKPFQCEQCPKKYAQKINLVIHTKKIHTKKLPFVCLVCRQGFLKQTHCKAHQKNCYRRRYECHLCKKFFDSMKIRLEAHICATHTGEKPFHWNGSSVNCVK